MYLVNNPEETFSICNIFKNYSLICDIEEIQESII